MIQQMVFSNRQQAPAKLYACFQQSFHGYTIIEQPLKTNIESFIVRKVMDS